MVLLLRAARVGEKVGNGITLEYRGPKSPILGPDSLLLLDCGRWVVRVSVVDFYIYILLLKPNAKLTNHQPSCGTYAQKVYPSSPYFGWCCFTSLLANLADFY